MQALHRFVDLEERSVAEAAHFCRELGLSLPEVASEEVPVGRRRLRGKMAPGERGPGSCPFLPLPAFAGGREGNHFKLGPGGIGYYREPTVQ